MKIEISNEAVQGSQEAYELFLEAANSYSGVLLPFRGDAILAYHNITAGLSALAGYEDRIAVELPTIKMEALKRLPILALGLLFAVEQVDRYAPSSGILRVLLKEAHKLRSILLASAIALAKSEVLPSREVEKIREGKGSIDAASDCVMLAALFQKHEALVAGKTAVTKEQIEACGKLGSKLVTILRPKRTRQEESKATKETVEIRD
jgi:hypothetical protein